MTPASDQAPDRDKSGASAVLLVVVGLLLVVGGAYAASYFLAADKLPRRTEIAGIDVGAKSPDAAARALEDGLGEWVDAPITVLVDGEEQQVTPAEAGLSVDYDASVEAAAGDPSWSPQHLWQHWTASVELDPVLRVDDGAMTTLLDRLAAEDGEPAVDGTVRFIRDGVRTTAPQLGRAVDPTAAREALVSAYLGDDPAELTLTTVAPDIDAADVQAAVDDFANPALAAPVMLVFGESPVQLRPDDFAPALSMEPEGGVLVPVVDTERLARLVDSVTGAEGKPVDATVALVDGKPQVVPAKPGVSYDPDDVATVLLDLLVQAPGEREGDVEATSADADFSTADAEALKIKERVSTFTTYFPYAEYRNTPRGRAAEIVDGTVLKPDEVFSLNDVVGERTRENGFTDGFIISNGIFKEDLGGGVSQMATTTFNAAFFAGLEDVEHKPHSFYIDRYPVGREATVAWGSVDLRFRNDTPYGVLISAKLTPSTPSSQGVLTVSMYSTKYWDITTTTSARYDYTAPATRTLSTPDCYPNTGYSGFSVDVLRFFRKPGESALDHQEKFHTVYTPSDTVICKPPKP